MPNPPEATLEVLEPATAAALESIPRAGAQDVDLPTAARPGGGRDRIDNEEEAVRLANDTIFGLTGSVWTRDGARALRVARALEAGVLSIDSNTSVRVTTDPHALDAYTEVKSIFYATS